MESLALHNDESEPTVVAAARATTPGNDKLPAAAADTSGDPPASSPQDMPALLSPPVNRGGRLEDRDDAPPSLDREDEQDASMYGQMTFSHYYRYSNAYHYPGLVRLIQLLDYAKTMSTSRPLIRCG